MFVNFNILNQLGSPAINSNTFANRPAAGQTGRLFVSTDTFEIYRDNGTTWDLIGGPGTSTITGTGQATEVAFFTSSQAIASSANLFWDNTNQYLGIGTSVPNAGVNVQDVDALGVLSNITTVAGTSTSSVSVWAKNTTNLAGYAGIFEEITPNSAAGQYPIKISHTLSSGTAAANMATGIHFGLPDNTGTERINQLSVDTVDPIAATYSNRYRFLLRSNGAAVTPFYITGTGLGVFTATPGAALDIHSTGIMVQLNSTSATANSLLAFQRSGNGLWRIGDAYNGGNNYFELHNTVLTNNAIQVLASSNEATFLSSKTYSTGNAIGVAVQHNLTIPNAVNVGLAAIGGVNSNLNLTLGGSTTVAATGRQGLEGSTTISFTGAGTLTMTQGSTVRAFSALSSVYGFNGSAVGTITHLAGLRICFPDNPGSAVNITNNYALLINNQTTGTGTVTYTNRWGIYQEGASDLNYMAANLLLGSTVNTGDKLQVTGTTYLSSQLTVGNTLYVDTVFNRVGINTNSPNSIFEVKSSGTGTKSISAAFLDSSTNGNGLQIYNENGLSSIYATYYFTGSNQDLGFYTTTSLGAQNEVMRLTSTQRVGIGTTNPTQKLTIVGDVGIPDGNKYLSSGGTQSYYAPNSGASELSYQTTLNIRAFNGNSPLSAMYFASGGNVGIGTTTPQVKLHVLNSAVGGSYYGGLTLETSGEAAMQIKGTTYSSIYFSDAANPYEGGIVYDHILDNLEFRGSGNAPDLTITSGGNVLIGTQTNSGEKLVVNGTNARFYSSGNYNSINIDNNSSTGGGACTVFQNNVRVGAIAVEGWWQGTGQDDLAIAADKPNIKFFTNGASQVKMSLSSAGNLETLGTIKTGAPTTGTAAAWKLGSRVAATVVVNTTEYIEIDIGGTLYKLATVT